MTVYKVKQDATSKCHIYKVENDGNLRKISDNNGEVHAHGCIYRAQKRSSDGKCCVFKISSDIGGGGTSELVLVQD